MEFNLTGGAVARIINEDVTTERDLKPVLQVIEMKEVQTKSKNPQQQQQEPKKIERFMLLLSDGSLTQPGVLATSKSELVKSSKLLVGSIVQLTQYICDVIHDRMIVIIIELEVIVEKYDIIGKPVPAPKSSRLTQIPTDQPGTVMAQTNSLGGRTSAGSADRADPTKKRRVEWSGKMAEAKERNSTPAIPSDMQAVLKRCETIEKEVRSLKLNLSFMNRKDSEQTKQIEELQKQNKELTDEKERLLEEIERIISDSGKM
ncbi:replication protein A 70 kDa DNA-binding subunit E-like [Durio zibethinus]|uniref:Replication protein A 70 kDa DNA-binding subunit E-like n=1 Tax=Durio zibethinus TaxID=66656 RepID=A0A6P5WLL4_DURZI|nr:replication protein A 70 kDa DNA-binding subunit E-like [Durio zibethinus]